MRRLFRHRAFISRGSSATHRKGRRLYRSRRLLRGLNLQFVNTGFQVQLGRRICGRMQLPGAHRIPSSHSILTLPQRRSRHWERKLKRSFIVTLRWRCRCTG